MGDVVYLRAEDDTGAFGILPGHTDFLTALAVSVASGAKLTFSTLVRGQNPQKRWQAEGTIRMILSTSWRDDRGAEHHVAVRGGMLEVRDGSTIAIATPEAVPGDDLQRLEAEVLARFRRQLFEEQAARTDAQRLYLAAIRQIARFLRAERAPTMPVMPTLDPGDGFAP